MTRKIKTGPVHRINIYQPNAVLHILSTLHSSLTTCGPVEMMSQFKSWTVKGYPDPPNSQKVKWLRPTTKLGSHVLIAKQHNDILEFGGCVVFCRCNLSALKIEQGASPSNVETSRGCLQDNLKYWSKVRFSLILPGKKKSFKLHLPSWHKSQVGGRNISIHFFLDLQAMLRWFTCTSLRSNCPKP